MLRSYLVRFSSRTHLRELHHHDGMQLHRPQRFLGSGCHMGVGDIWHGLTCNKEFACTKYQNAMYGNQRFCKILQPAAPSSTSSPVAILLCSYPPSPPPVFAWGCMGHAVCAIGLHGACGVCHGVAWGMRCVPWGCMGHVACGVCHGVAERVSRSIYSSIISFTKPIHHINKSLLIPI